MIIVLMRPLVLACFLVTCESMEIFALAFNKFYVFALGGQKKSVKQLRWRRQNINPATSSKHGNFWADIEKISIPEEKFLELFAQTEQKAPKVCVAHSLKKNVKRERERERRCMRTRNGERERPQKLYVPKVQCHLSTVSIFG